MVFASVWKRFVSLFIDFLVFIPFMFLSMWLKKFGKIEILLCNIITGVCFQGYFILCHYYFGQTIGKFFVKIKVYSFDMSKLTIYQSIRRNAIDLIFQFIVIIVFILIYQSISYSQIIHKTSREINQIISNAYPVWYHSISKYLVYFPLVNIVIMLIDKKKRAIQDIIGKTIVLNLNPNKS